MSKFPFEVAVSERRLTIYRARSRVAVYYCQEYRESRSEIE